MGWTRFVRRVRWDDERRRELRSYLEIETDDNIARGMTADEARAAACRKLGNPTLVREEIFRMNSFTRTESIWKDLTFGARVLWRSPGFALVALLSLGLGIGANTALFHLLDAVRLRVLPVERPHELVEIRVQPPESGRTGSFTSRNPAMTAPLWDELRTGLTTVTGLFAWSDERFDLASSGQSRFINGLWVSGGLFETLGLQPAHGRLIGPADDERGCGAPVAVLGHGFWQREYGGRADVLGRSIALDGHPLTIVGVAPASFFGLEVGRAFDVALPLCAEPILHGRDTQLARRDAWWITINGRLAPGVSREQATAELEGRSPGIFAATVPGGYTPDLVRDYAAFQLEAIDASRGFSPLRTGYETPLWLLLGIAGAVLLIACGNLANLMLARATAREREIAVRLAIGASRGRIVRQFMTESLLLAIAGAALGLWIASALGPLLLSYLSTDRSPLYLDLGIDWRVMLFAAALATGTCLLFGLLPAVRATRTPPLAAMRSGGRGTTDGRERFAARRLLVVVQVATSLVLLVGALLFVRTLANLDRVDPGFRVDGLLVARLDLRGSGAEGEALTTVTRDLIEAIRALPGVDGVTAVDLVPLAGGGWNQAVIVDGKRQEGYPQANRVDHAFLNVLEIPLVRGRTFEASDHAGAPPVAMVNEAFAAKYFPDRSAVGRRFRLEVGPGSPDPDYEVIGVVGNTQYYNLRETPPPTIFFARSQAPEPAPFLAMLVRSEQAVGTLSQAIVRTADWVAPSALASFTAFDTQVRDTLRRERLMATLSGLFGALAAVLAITGLYGVMSYMVARRRNEIGVRMALGAGRGRVLALVLKETGVLVAIGLGIGLGLAAMLGRYTESLLFGLTPQDPSTLAAATALLASVAALAGLVPAWRATRVEPTSALRE